MISNIDKYKKDLDELIKDGSMLQQSMYQACVPEQLKEAYKGKLKAAEYTKFLSELPNFSKKYQTWYSEALVLIKQLLPDRLEDFAKLYVKPKNRKAITWENYTIEDYLRDLTVTRGWDKEEVVGPRAAIPLFTQQVNILASIKKRFESSLFDIIQLVQADLFDSELETAIALNKSGFIRGAGAIAGVVLEKHLSQVCITHSVKITKKDPSISEYNDKLKEAGVYDTSLWRKIQHLGDLRNLCDHKKEREPTSDDVIDLVDGVNKVIKTVS